MNRIASFSVDHDYITPGVYLSRVDGDVTTYDMRTRAPNAGDYMDNATMHTFEHMFATFIRNSPIGAQVVYFGPMGCQTGFYLLIRNAEHARVLDAITRALDDILGYKGEVFGGTRKECGNFANLNLELAKAEAARYLQVARAANARKLTYPSGGNS